MWKYWKSIIFQVWYCINNKTTEIHARGNRAGQTFVRSQFPENTTRNVNMVLVHGVKKISECTPWTCSAARRYQVTCRGLSCAAAGRCWQVEGPAAGFLKSQSRGCRAARSSLLSVLGISSPKSLASVTVFSIAVAVRILGGWGSSDCRDRSPNMEIFQMWSEIWTSKMVHPEAMSS